MSRVIKFRAWIPDIERMYQVYSIDTDSNGNLPKTVTVWEHPSYKSAVIKNKRATFVLGTGVEVIQFTGQKDKNDADIYKGDLLNICFTSGSGEHIHDCIYQAEIGHLGGLEFRFIGLKWESFGYNQYPISTTLCEKYNTLDTVYSHKHSREFLIVGDKHLVDVKSSRDFPFNREKELSFYSRYFEVIGNIYENPELLKECK